MPITAQQREEIKEVIFDLVKSDEEKQGFAWAIDHFDGEHPLAIYTGDEKEGTPLHSLANTAAGLNARWETPTLSTRMQEKNIDFGMHGYLTDKNLSGLDETPGWVLVLCPNRDALTCLRETSEFTFIKMSDDILAEMKNYQLPPGVKKQVPHPGSPHPAFGAPVSAPAP